MSSCLRCSFKAHRLCLVCSGVTQLRHDWTDMDANSQAQFEQNLISDMSAVLKIGTTQYVCALLLLCSVLNAESRWWSHLAQNRLSSSHLPLPFRSACVRFASPNTHATRRVTLHNTCAISMKLSFETLNLSCTTTRASSLNKPTQQSMASQPAAPLVAQPGVRVGVCVC